MNAQQFARHLRHNRGVRIAIDRTVIPPEWVPHPVTARKVGGAASTRLYAKAIAAWRQQVHTSSRWAGRAFPDAGDLYVIG